MPKKFTGFQNFGKKQITTLSIVGIGIQPDILVSKSLEDYLTDKDPTLEKAIEFLKSK